MYAGQPINETIAQILFPDRLIVSMNHLPIALLQSANSKL